MEALAWLLGACCLRWVLASGERDGKKSQQVAARREMTREAEPRRFGVAAMENVAVWETATLGQVWARGGWRLGNEKE
ncbi:unnamed protein product [Miscanthus lutarioriparius]|uniref:Secreted protein n=1 Tax=Miscanthus lutarioriparius TaxID=422564 RepID=A0A811RAR3_9POAL|nr:unnamed protein product [Miscanthus lutarioriparius]